jgi:hypothetical protein
MARPDPIDQEAAKAQEDEVAKALEAMSERHRWIMYQALFNMGHRIDRARHEIEKLVPRKAVTA